METQETVEEDFDDVDMLINIDKDLVTSELESLDDIISDIMVIDKPNQEKEDDKPACPAPSPWISPKLGMRGFLRQYGLDSHWMKGPRQANFTIFWIGLKKSDCMFKQSKIDN